MLTADAITREIPRLRRYARVLTGNQAAGDAYVSATLEALAEDTSALALDTTIGLFRTFTRIWNSVELADGSGKPAKASDRHLSHVGPMPRQAFLLLSLEDFPEEEAALILGVDVGELRALVDQFGKELASEIATNVLIIEDEPLIALGLEELVQRLGHNVIGLARTRDEAIDLAKAQRPGLILADIQLQDDSSGLDAANDLVSRAEAPVVFITAYPERLLTGKRPEPAFLVPKPFRETHVAAVVTQALFFDRKAKALPQAH
jgi:CheY-like chemotaxis protein/DNA-directed RNA polymerase specialized sigma24 family protein